MTGFLDVLFRGLMLAGGAAALGGVVFLHAVLRAGPGVKPDPVTARSLRLVVCGAVVVSGAQLAVVALAFAALAGDGASAGTFLQTPFAFVSIGRIVLGVITAALALRLARGAAGRPAWAAVSGAAFLLVASSTAISHAAARLDGRATLMALDAVHQIAAAVWVGGLGHLMMSGGGGDARAVARRFSVLALASVATLVAAGVALSVTYLGSFAALLETAYGVMVLTKAVLLAAILAVALANVRLVRRAATAAPDRRLVG